jgi:DNA-binding response OmpR family regulator
LEERPGIKVMVMSGADISEIVRKNAKLMFLPKPVDGGTLTARVRAILTDSRSASDHGTQQTS